MRLFFPPLYDAPTILKEKTLHTSSAVEISVSNGVEYEGDIMGCCKRLHSETNTFITTK